MPLWSAFNGIAQHAGKKVRRGRLAASGKIREKTPASASHEEGFEFFERRVVAAALEQTKLAQ